MARSSAAGKAIHIISGGQTGADRAALAWATRRGFSHEGWCPKGRLAEDDRIPRRYRLRETPSGRYRQRTEWNVRDSDATVIFSRSFRLAGGSRHALQACEKLGKPVLHIPQEIVTILEGATLLRQFLRRHRARRLNIAGPRKSDEPGIGRFVQSVLDETFGFT